jgi:hypothetical protein
MGQSCTYQEIESFLAREHIDATSFSEIEASKFVRVLRQLKSDLCGGRCAVLEVGVGETDGKDVIIRRGIDLSGRIYTNASLPAGIIPGGNQYYDPKLLSGQPVFFSLCRWRSGGEDYNLFELKSAPGPQRVLQLI